MKILHLEERMKKPLLIILAALTILFGGIFIYKLFISIMMKHYFESLKNPTITVSSTRAAYTDWYPEIKAVGSTRATLGVEVTAQLGGMIQNIYFVPGSIVEAGTLLVQQNADPNIALLHSLQANAELAQITYDRDLKQYKAKGVSKQQVDSDLQNLKSLRAQVAQQQAIVTQLTITAPFKGRLGVSEVNPGQYLNPGDKVVTLQSLDPIYNDFYLPQQALAHLKVGQEVDVMIDTFPDRVFKGKITTINPIVEKDTRNVEVEATLPNPTYELLPGMFSNVIVKVDEPKKALTLPQTAITYNPYGDLVYIVKETGKSDDNKPLYKAVQEFVQVGEKRGDQVAIISGIKENEEVVTSGQLKLRNNSPIAINNKVQTSDSANPPVPNDH